MAVFSAEDSSRLDFEILKAGGISLYYQHEILAEDVSWLALEKYEVVQFEDEAMDSMDAFHFEARLKFGVGAEYEATPDGFRTSASQLSLVEPGRVALVLTGIDRLAADDPEQTRALLDAVAMLSCEGLLFGRRIIALAQSDVGDLEIGPIGARSIGWNARERAGWTRGL